MENTDIVIEKKYQQVKSKQEITEQRNKFIFDFLYQV
jgi:hypothetical protein